MTSPRHPSFRPAGSGLAVAAALSLLLAACALPGPSPKPLPLTTPEAAGLAADARSTETPAEWWQALGDPQLDRLVGQALQDSPSLAVARSRLGRAISLAELTRSTSGVQAGLGLDATRQRYSENGLVPPPIAGGIYNSATLQIGLQWEPDLFGKHDAELRAALGQTRASQADAAVARTALAAQVSHVYLGLARLVAQREVAERTLAQRTEMLKLISDRVSAGLDTSVELRQGEGALPDARTQIEALAEQIALARHQLAALTAQPIEALATLQPSLAVLRSQQPPASLGADLLGRRPDVVAARWRVEAAGEDIKSARAAFYPNVNLSAFIGFSAIGLDKLIDVGSRQIGAGPAIRLPLFDAGRLRAQLNGRHADLDGAIAQYNASVLDAVREASDAIASLQSIARQRTEQAAAQRSLESAYDLALQRYRAGIGGYLTVLNAESQVLAQRRLGVDLQARLLDTQVSLMKSLGGGWQDSASPTTTVATSTATAATLAAAR
ncbi:MAG TPA: efflux transporter outer membrane subunit [Ideonella sp.]|nr:efflux transporter outer membrane subunit [Ideonella sp.]